MGLTEVLLVVAVGGGIAAVLFATFRGAAADAVAADAGGAMADSESDGERARLQESQRGVVRALEEIEADHEAGNLSDADYETLRRRYEREAASVLRQLGGLERPAREGAAAARSAPPAGGSPWPAAIGWAAGIVGFVALALAVMSSAVQPRSEEGAITGTVPGRSSAMEGGALPAVDAERLSALERRVADDSSDVEALVELGHLYLAGQRFLDVARVSMKALSVDPGNPEALTHLGLVLVSVDHIEDGLAAFERALESDPDFAEALLFKGMVAFQNHDFQTAVQAWDRYVEVAPPDANLGRIRGMLESAREAVEVAR